LFEGAASSRHRLRRFLAACSRPLLHRDGQHGRPELTAWSSAPSETKWLAREARLLPRPPDPAPEVDQLLSEFVDVLHAPDDLEPEDAARLTARIAELRASIVSLVMRHRPNDG